MMHGAVMVLLFLGFPFCGGTAAMLGAVIASLVFYLCALSRGQTDPIEALLLRADERWWIKTRGHEAMSAELLPGEFVSPWLTVLCFGLADGRRRTAFMLADNVRAAPFRRLRVRLRVRRKQSDRLLVGR